MLVGLAWLAGCGQPQRHPVVPIPPLPQENVTPQSDAHRQVAAPLRRLAPVVSDLPGWSVPAISRPLAALGQQTPPGKS